MTILVVEDLKELRELLTRALRASGYEVLAVGHAEDALQLLEDPSLDLRLLLTDWNLPGMTGRDLALALRRRHPRLRVLLASGLSHEELSNLDWLNGWGEYLAKPFEFDAMLAALERLQAQP